MGAGAPPPPAARLAVDLRLLRLFGGSKDHGDDCFTLRVLAGVSHSSVCCIQVLHSGVAFLACSAASWRWSSCSGRWCLSRTDTAPRLGRGTHRERAQAGWAAGMGASCIVQLPAPQHGLAAPLPLPLQFVFRQGSPLDPAALRLVAAQDARAIIVSGDYRWVVGWLSWVGGRTGGWVGGWV